MANNFSGDSNCVALWKFDNNADDSLGGNDLTEVNSPAYDGSDKKEGGYCLDLERDNGQYCLIADADLDTGFPGKSGGNEPSISICLWVKAESFSTGYQGLVTKYQTAGDLRTFSLMIDGSGQVQFNVGYNSGQSYSLHEFNTLLSAGKWYHIGVVYDASDNSVKIRVWDDDAGALLDSNYSGTAGGDMSPRSAPFEVGRYNNSNSYCFDGKIDELVVFDKALSDSDIDAIRAGTYGPTVTEKDAADTGSGAEAVVSLESQQDKVAADSGSGLDAVESLETPSAKTASDSGSGVEAVILRLLGAAEAGSGAEASAVGGGGTENLFAEEQAKGDDRLVAKIEMPTKGGGIKLWT